MGRSGGGIGGGGFGGGGFGGSFGGGRSGGSFGSTGRSGSTGFGSGSSGSRSGWGSPSHNKSYGAPRIGLGVPIYRAPTVIVDNSRRYGGGSPGGGSGNKKGSGGFSKVLITLVVVFICLVLLLGIVGLFSGTGKITKSTVERMPLPGGSVIETEYYTDEPGWIANKNALLAGMKSFYRETGVQPYLYIAQSIPKTTAVSAQEMQRYAEELYDKLFEDEAHFLLVFYDYGNGQYICGYWQGAQTKAVMDSEAVAVLANYIGQYYYSDMSEEEFFSKSFANTATRIMTVTKSPLPSIIISLVLLAAIIVVFLWWKKAKEQKNLEAKATADILNTPLEKFGDTEVEELAKKYQQDTK